MFIAEILNRKKINIEDSMGGAGVSGRNPQSLQLFHTFEKVYIGGVDLVKAKIPKLDQRS